MNRVVVDLELGRGYGYGLADLPIAGFAVAVTWDDVDGLLHWSGGQGRQLLDYLLGHDQIVGFNLLSYDNPVLGGYLLPSEREMAGRLQGKTVDLHALLRAATGRRYSLESVALETLGATKLRPPEDEDAELLAEYCERDVELTRDLDDFRRQYGLLYVRGGQAVPLPGGKAMREVAR